MSDGSNHPKLTRHELSLLIKIGDAKELQIEHYHRDPAIHGLAASGLIYAVSVSAELMCLRLTPEGVQVLARARQP